MKKSLYPTILGLTIALFSLVSTAPTAFASTRQVSTTHKASTASMRTVSRSCHPNCWPTHNQYFHGNAYSGLHQTFKGHNMNNSGNQGHNRSFNRSFDTNGGNLIVNHGRSSRYPRIIQHFYGNSYSRNRQYFVGYNENNAGNQGLNDGVNESHAGNAGNMIAN